ncbi:hypothetical protein NC652_001983 [Populus alba x Populus x berolinensis]|nr:hypothetical protein NC652_001983 [Populus alba x Populus x berolinensis]
MNMIHKGEMLKFFTDICTLLEMWVPPLREVWERSWLMAL